MQFPSYWQVSPLTRPLYEEVLKPVNPLQRRLDQANPAGRMVNMLGGDKGPGLGVGSDPLGAAPGSNATADMSTTTTNNPGGMLGAIGLMSGVGSPLGIASLAHAVATNRDPAEMSIGRAINGLLGFNRGFATPYGQDFDAVETMGFATPYGQDFDAVAAGMGDGGFGATGMDGGISGPDSTGGMGGADRAKGGPINRVVGPNPPGPDHGYSKAQVGEYMMSRKAVKKYGTGLLSALNEGRVEKKKLKGLLGAI